MPQTAKQRVKMRKDAGFGSVLVVEQKTGVLKDRVANFENQGARKADLRLFDALALSPWTSRFRFRSFPSRGATLRHNSGTRDQRLSY